MRPKQKKSRGLQKYKTIMASSLDILSATNDILFETDVMVQKY